MKFRFFALLFMVFNCAINAQNLDMTSPDQDQSNPLDCSIFSNGSITNFTDDGGGGNYSNNFNDTLVLCPDLSQGSKVTVAFGINAGFSWGVDSTDSIYVYDGPNTASNLLGVHNSLTDPNGFNHQATFLNNPSGCLTLVFISDSVQNGSGWDANVTCGNPAQPFIPHMQAYENGPGNGDTLTPADTGLVKVCPGDSILYVGWAEFPYSLENAGTGYSQNSTNVTYKWFFSNGFIATGDSIWFHPPNNAGYVVTLQISDQFPYKEQLISYVRVAPRIDFSATRALNDSICEGDTIQLIAGVNPNDTVGVSPTVAITEVGGSFAGLTYLPDGSGANYEATIEISGFGAGQTLSTGKDIMRLAITMEHSFLGDLEMIMTCPSGDTAVIFNSYGGGGVSAGELAAGGFGGGGTYLGDAYDNNIGNPGIGWTYSFSDTIPNWGTMAQEYGAGNTLPATTFSGFGNAMNPDSIYLPEQNFDAFIGCPINGTWTLIIRDNLSIDDGYIFDWAIFFNPYINPNFQSYTSQLTTSQWFDDMNGFLGNAGDTIVSLMPDTFGINSYRFEVMDDFGCVSDTTIEVYHTKSPNTGVIDTISCLSQVPMNVFGADSALWVTFSNNAGDLTFISNNKDTSIILSAANPGVFDLELSMYKNNCVFIDTARFLYAEDLPVNLINDTIACLSALKLGTSFVDTNGAYSYAWGPGGQTTDSLLITQSGMYYVTISGCNTQEDSALIQLFEPPYIVGDYLICDSQQVIWIDHHNFEGGWKLINTDIVDGDYTFIPFGDSLYLSSSKLGLLQVGFADSLCKTVDTVEFVFQHKPHAEIIDSLICLKDIPLVLKANVYPENTISYTWTGNSRDTTLEVFEAGVYKLKVDNVCGSFEDTVHVSFRDCNYIVPNVLTPNGDGLNDVFALVNREFYSSIEFAIYNRWGQKVYESHNQLAVWDGFNQNGEMCADGTYFFVVEIDGATETGSITLITGK